MATRAVTPDVTVAAARPTVLVTGAAGGVGSACLARFLEGGWLVAGTDLLAPPSTSTSPSPVPHLPPEGAEFFLGDLRQASECRRIVAEAAAWAKSSGSQLQAVVNAAGMWTEGPTQDTDEADWNSVIDVNLKGTFFVAAAAIPFLKISRGSIVNISSDAGIQGNRGAAVYCASKGGVSVLTKALALELAPFGVRCNAVCPSDIDTQMLQYQADTYGGGDPDAYIAGLMNAYPGGSTASLLQASDVAELVWYLCQPHARGINGANLSIDQALTAGIF